MRLLIVAVLYVTTTYLFFAITSSAVVDFTTRLSSTTKDTSSCHTVLQYVETAYFLNVAQQLRGADENMLLFYFNKSVETLLQVLQDKYSSKNMSEVCLDPFDVGRITLASVQYFSVPNSGLSMLEEFSLEFNQFMINSTMYVNNDSSSLTTTRWTTLSSNSSLSGLLSSFTSAVTSVSTAYVTIPTDIFNITLSEDLNVTVNAKEYFDESFYTESFQVMGVGSATFNIRFLRYYDNFQGNLFYIPKENYSDDSLVMHNNELVNQIWSEIEHFIINSSPGPREILLPFIARLPKTVEVFFDPAEDEVNSRFTQNTANATQVNGFQLLCNVTANVLKMYIAGLPVSTCLTPLDHLAKHIFNAMRVNKVEGKNVTVPNIYVPFYNGYYTTAVENVSVPEEALRVTPAKVEEVYEKDLLGLLVFSTHGRLNCNVLDPNGTFTTVDISTQLFDKDKVELVQKEDPTAELAKTTRTRRIGNYLFGIAFSERLHKWFNSFLNIQLPWVPGEVQASGRQTIVCEEEYIYHDPVSNNSWVTQDEHYCCARICIDIDVINSPGILSVDHCCSLCNAVSCPTHEGSPMAQLLTIMVNEYGWLDDDVGTVVL